MRKRTNQSAMNINQPTLLSFSLSSQNMSWLEDLEMLIARFSYLGIGADIASLSLSELSGLYLHLSRLKDE